jgi:hypothetical protein
MCLKGLTQPSSRTTGPASNFPEPPAAKPGITEEKRRTIVEMMAEGTDAGTNLDSADLGDPVAQLWASGADVVQAPTEPPVRGSRLRLPIGS